MSERMLDRIVRGNFQIPGYLASELDVPRTKANIQQGAASAAAFEVSNVIEYWASGTDKRAWNWQKDYPSIAPPFDVMWLEGAFPQESLAGIRVGALVDSTRFGGEVSLESAVARFASKTEHWKAISPIGSDLTAGWVSCWTLFQSVKGHGVVGPVVNVLLILGTDGAPAAEAVTFLPVEIDETFIDTALGHGSIVMPLALAVSFMHCKNVRVQEEESQLSRPERRRLERAGLDPVRFKTLDIAPMRQILDHEGGAETNGLQRALHICRGHFATYTEDRPLFGRHAGTFWVPAHVKGSVKEGIVGKDYRVLAPKATGGNA